MWSHILWFFIMVESSAGSNHLQKFEVRGFFWMVRVGSSLRRFDNKSEVRNGSKISFSGFWPGFGLFPTDLCFKVRDYFCGSSYQGSEFEFRNFWVRATITIINYMSINSLEHTRHKQKNRIF